MRTLRLLVIAALCALLVGCGTASGKGIRRGTPITDVQLDYGFPDVISDQSGDRARYYLTTDRPAAEWPADAPRTFYYIERNLAITFVCGKVIRATPIEPELREHMLMPLVRRREASTLPQLRDGDGFLTDAGLRSFAQQLPLGTPRTEIESQLGIGTVGFHNSVLYAVPRGVELLIGYDSRDGRDVVSRKFLVQNGSVDELR